MSPINDQDKFDELTDGLEELKTTVEELQIEKPTDIDAGRLETVKSALERASDAAGEIEDGQDSNAPIASEE